MSPDYMIISCSWHGAINSTLLYSSCSYPKICHNILCPLFQECCVLCNLLFCELCCCGIAAPCVAATVTTRKNQHNSSETNVCCISAAWFFWCLCCCQSVKLCAFILNDKMQYNILHIQNCSNLQNQNLIFSVPSADKEIAAAKYQLPR